MTAPKKSPQADLQADLLIDLAGPVVEVPPAPAVDPAPTPPDSSDATPSVSFAWTPLRWNRPKVTSVRGGMGKALTVGPLKVELAVKQ